MTERRVNRIRAKIKRIKNALSSDKRQWGGYYHDGQGLRYDPPGLYLKIQDYKCALTYFKWFDKNFPDDSGFPIFLLEWTITLHKTGNIKTAEKKALQTFFANTYLFDKFFGKPFLQLDKYENSNWEQSSLAADLEYSKDQPELHDFAEWLSKFITSDKFYKIANEFIDIQKQLVIEPVGLKRSKLVNRSYKLLDNF